MQCLDLTFPTPAENLACDEALLDMMEKRVGAGVLRFWEADEPFVVVGYANKVAVEVNLPACAASGVSIYRRCSGGGTVLQAAGCLNYALVLEIASNSALASVAGANRFIMKHNRMAIESLLRNREPGGLPVSVQGHTDLALRNRKFSGNSQRRKKAYLLFHGTVLLNMNLELAGKFLRMPSLQPDYRERRSHADFLVNLRLNAADVKGALRKVWGAGEDFAGVPLKEIRRLVLDKYATREWNEKS